MYMFCREKAFKTFVTKSVVAMASTSNSNSLSSSTSSTSAGTSDTNISENINNSLTNRVVANMSGDGNSNETPALESPSVVSTVESDFKKITSDRDELVRLYEQIREKCEREAIDKKFSTSESDKPVNRSLNRYRDVNPYNHSRIILHRGGVNYINANLVKFERADRKYILTQGPLCETMSHFWLMVWEQNSKAILMLNKLTEKKQVKCHLYWPESRSVEDALEFNDVKLLVQMYRSEEYKNYIIRWFKLTDMETNETRDITQFHYTTWPDFGIPTSPVAFLQYLKNVRDSGTLDANFGPAIVHCSAGIGRSGTFCLVDCCLVLVENEGVENLSVPDVLCELRRYRMGLIQTADQLLFSYKAIMEGIKLLNDPKFINLNESPIVSSDDGEHHEHSNPEEAPPPLPPRTLSLLPTGGNVAEVNFESLERKPDNDKSNKDALNNFINNERNIETNTGMSNRPLPPLPKTNHSMKLIHESDSDENGCIDDSEEETVEEVDNDDSDDDTEHYDNSNYNKMKSKDKPTQHLELQESNVKPSEQNGEYDAMKINGIEAADSASQSNDTVRRRTRAERQANIEEKVNEIKRKQRENYDNEKKAKKRRSLFYYITAGVIVGFICVYAYSRWH